MLLAAKLNFLFAKLQRFFLSCLHFIEHSFLQTVKLQVFFIKALYQRRNISLFLGNIISCGPADFLWKPGFLGNIKGVTFTGNSHQKMIRR